MALTIEAFLDGPAKVLDFSEESLRGLLDDSIQLMLAFPPLCNGKREKAYDVFMQQEYLATADLIKDLGFITCSLSHGPIPGDTPDSESGDSQPQSP